MHVSRTKAGSLLPGLIESLSQDRDQGTDIAACCMVIVEVNLQPAYYCIAGLVVAELVRQVKDPNVGFAHALGRTGDRVRCQSFTPRVRATPWAAAG